LSSLVDGYQIAAIANRTTLADGNTWNHEHIALLGKALTTDLESGWEIARHLADYVLVWGGGGGDDLAKSPHLARIANSVYRDHCPDDPTCRAFGFVDRQGTPSSMMKRSLLYGLHGHQLKPDVEVSADRFQEVYRSTYGRVRIYKVIGISEESRAWVADPVNRKCDTPGSWFCPGQYPPGLKDILSRKTDFRQLEDFNRGSGGDSQYQEQYFKDLHDPEAVRRKIMEKERTERVKEQQRGMSDEEKKRQLQKRDETYNSWADTDDTTMMWRLISTNDVAGLKAWLEAEPNKAFIRSKDGRGPMWWSFEQRNEEITKVLMKAGVPHTDVDAKGLSPMDLIDSNK
jgi:dolichyl-diphosphooligosaccharide---protein glycosyltransferase